MNKIFLICIFVTILFSGCSIGSYLSDPQMKKFAVSKGFLERSEKKPNTVIAAIRDTTQDIWNNPYYFTMKDTHGKTLKEEPIYFNHVGVGYVNFWWDEMDLFLEPYTLIVTQLDNTLYKGSVIEIVRLRSEIASYTPY
ncbi:MAG: hypothetical protein ACI88L_000239 [Candidatus Paceibacteria bacterium]|jgi:hypothetical protein